MVAPTRNGVSVGTLSPRLQKLLADAKIAEPYEVADDVVVTPPNKKRRDDMNEAQVRVLASQQTYTRLLNKVLPQRPKYPMPPVPVEPLGDKPSAKKQADHKKAQAEYDEALRSFDTAVEQWSEANTEWEGLVERHDDALTVLSEKITEDSIAYTKALFGPAYDAIIALFEDQPPELWEAFKVDIQQHFGLIAKPPQVPDDGRCRECGQVVDEEQAGKALTSST